ncbi:thioesterase superfamily protein [Ammonifex degensii KC4]|uniref:Acyl-coenzyme A thioesterase THEM4 n=1 Tax=Ammonifex degensii (strain DSM 10501 / KC4) TaxID=429009 RepID=C9RD72_AMMDK|nr:PaaI family thioesterase [Ammonifex degensii]ACX52199.1 thioesterase superfamily protein [Ammonifex degensii KC4]
MPKGLSPEDNWCFACGPANPIGLKLSFYEEGEKVKARFRVKPEHQGWPGLVHGGLLATLCDEAMAQWLWRRGFVAFTGELKVRFRRGVAVGEEVLVEAWLKERKGPLFLLAAQVLNAAGLPAVTAEGKFILKGHNP